jgi:hypothetical protein
MPRSVDEAEQGLARLEREAEERLRPATPFRARGVGI